MSVSRHIQSIEPRLLMSGTTVITQTFIDPRDGVTTQDAQYWRVDGNTLDGIDENASGPDIDDNIVVRPSADNLEIQAFLNGTLIGSVAKGSVKGVLIAGLQGNDTLTVETTINSDPAITEPNQIDVPAYFQGGKGADLITGGPETSIIQGGVGNDTLFGGVGRDVIRGGKGNDSIGGGDNRDSIFGGAGNDTIIGGKGADTLLGGPGSDFIQGLSDNDLIIGGPTDGLTADVDTLQGNFNNDTVYANAANGDVTDNNGSNPSDVYFDVPLTGPITVATHFSQLDFVTVNGEQGLIDINRQFDLTYKISSFLFTTPST